MEKKNLDNIKQQLEERRKELRTLMMRTDQEGREADNADIAQDVADRALNSYQKEFLFHQSSGFRNMVQAIEGALARIGDGSYGECINCGNDIESKRLEAVPWARHCLACQEKIERGELQV